MYWNIGCGDAMPVLPHLLSHGVIHYTGYDLSAPALQLAASNLSGIRRTVTLKEGNMQQLIEEESKHFNLIISSFSVHHLVDDDKMRLLQNCYKHLNPGGKMIYTDIFMTQQPDRDFYLKEYMENINSNWPLMTQNEKQPIFDHITQFDFPSPLEQTLALCKTFGFESKIILQPDIWHSMILLEKKNC